MSLHLLKVANYNHPVGLNFGLSAFQFLKAGFDHLSFPRDDPYFFPNELIVKPFNKLEEMLVLTGVIAAAIFKPTTDQFRKLGDLAPSSFRVIFFFTRKALQLEADKLS
jgi:hypothetical protein